jgi:hypothetical protein
MERLEINFDFDVMENIIFNDLVRNYNDLFYRTFKKT